MTIFSVFKSFGVVGKYRVFVAASPYPLKVLSGVDRLGMFNDDGVTDAIILSEEGSAQTKIAAMIEAGITVARSPAGIGEAVARAVGLPL